MRVAIRTTWLAATAFAAAVAVAGGACSGESPGPEDELIDAWIDAAGGLNAWRQIEDLRYTVTTVWFDSTGTETRRRPRFVWLKKHPERARIERDEAEGHYVQGHDGEGTAWATLDGEPLPGDHKAVEEALYVGRDVMYWIGLPYKLRDAGVNLAYISPDSTGHPGVQVTFGENVGEHPGDRYFYYFEEGSPFPVELHYIEQGDSLEDIDRTHWTAYQTSGPLTYVGTRTWYEEDGLPTKRLIISDVMVDPGIPDSMFTAPYESGMSDNP